MNENKKLNFSALVAMIIGSTIGSGIFTTTADMAHPVLIQALFLSARESAELVCWALPCASLV